MVGLWNGKATERLLFFCRLVLPVVLSILFAHTQVVGATGISDSSGQFIVEISNTNVNPYTDRFIYNFDVSETGKCALFLDDATVLILNVDGSVENIVRFDDNILKGRRSPSNNIIRWDDNKLELMIGGGDFCRFTEEGQIIEVGKHEVEGTFFEKQESVRIGEYTYAISCSNVLLRLVGGSRYDLLTRIDEQGNREILFQSDKQFPSGDFSLFFMVILLVHIIGAIAVIREIGQRRKQNRNT